MSQSFKFLKARFSKIAPLIQNLFLSESKVLGSPCHRGKASSRWHWSPRGWEGSAKSVSRRSWLFQPPFPSLSAATPGAGRAHWFIALFHLIASVLWKLSFSLSLCPLISFLLTPLLGPPGDNNTKIYGHFSLWCPLRGVLFWSGSLNLAEAEGASSLSLWAGILNQLQLEPLGSASCDSSQWELLWMQLPERKASRESRQALPLLQVNFF